MHSVTDVAMVKHAGFHNAVSLLKRGGKLRHAGISSHGPRSEPGDEDMALPADMERPYLYFRLKGAGTVPKLNFDRREVRGSSAGGAPFISRSGGPVALHSSAAERRAEKCVGRRGNATSAEKCVGPQVVLPIVPLNIRARALFYLQNEATQVYLFLDLGVAAWKTDTPLPLPLLLLMSFAAGLGDTEALDLAIFAEHEGLFLGIRVDDDTEMDRLPIGSAPYAAFAERCGRATPQFGAAKGGHRQRSEPRESI